MRKKKQDKFRFLAAIGVTCAVWIGGLMQIFGTIHYTPGANGIWIPVYPDPLLVMIITTFMVLVSLYMWHWYRMDRVQRALSALNHDERQQVLLKLAQQTASERLILNDEGELEESVVTHKRKNDQAI